MSGADPVVRLLADLDQPANPTTAFRDRLLVRLLVELEGANRRQQEAHASGRSNGWRPRVLRALTRRPRRTLLVAAAVTGAAAAALFVSSPWKTAPGFLEQVNAAIAPPAGSVLHVRLVLTENRRCPVTQPAVEWWADLAPPRKYRVIDILANIEDLCKAGISIERGGEPASGKALVFLPPNTLAISQMYAYELNTDPDPFHKLRQAIDGGTAHVEGQTEIDGSAVTRIRVDCTKEQRAKYSPCDSIYVFVDPETYRPVRSVSGPGVRPGPGGACKPECYIQDFEAYEYLPGTPANRALADIRAQHPNATETTLSPKREMDEIRARYQDATWP